MYTACESTEDLYTRSNRVDQSLSPDNQARLHLQVPLQTAHKMMILIIVPKFVVLTIKTICLEREIAVWMQPHVPNTSNPTEHRRRRKPHHSLELPRNPFLCSLLCVHCMCSIRRGDNCSSAQPRASPAGHPSTSHPTSSDVSLQHLLFPCGFAVDSVGAAL